jgi:hypothetical protein
MNPKFEARKIISEHTDAMIQSTHYIPDNHQELYETMVEGCAFILTEWFLDGRYTPMEYNAIRNELAEVLWNMFEKHINAEFTVKIYAVGH